jgi:outer membrane protein TolC
MVALVSHHAALAQGTNSTANKLLPASPAANKTKSNKYSATIQPLVAPVTNSFQLTLDEAIGIALEQNPDLLAVRAAEPVAAAAMRVAEKYPYNPQFQTQVLPYSRDQNGEDGSVSQQHVVVQTFEFGRQQRHREGFASAGWRQVHGTIRQAELTNVSLTSRLYFTALYQRELRDLNASLADLNEQLIGVIERREKAGQANKADVELARLQSKASRRQQRLSEATYQTALLSLRNQLNFDHDTPMELAGHWSDWQWQPIEHVIGGDQMDLNHTESTLSTLQSLDDQTLRQLVVNRPDVAAARSAVAMADENMRLANGMRRPNLQAGPMYQRDNSATTFWGVQAQIDIPVVNTGRPLVQQRCAELRQQQIAAEQLEHRAVLEARAAIQRYQRALRMVEESRADFSRDLSDSLKPFEDQFKAGQITLLQVFAARTTLAQSQQSFFDLLNELSLATADVTQATGMPPQQLITITQP